MGAMKTQTATAEPDIRLNMRITREQRDRIARAARKRGLTTSAFMRCAGLDEAKRVLAARD